MQFQCIIAFVAAACLTLTSAAQDAPPAAAPQHSLELKVAKGTELWFRTKDQLDQAMELAGAPMENTITTTSDLQVKVVEVREDGSARLEMKYVRIWGELDSPMGSASFDTAKTEEPDEDDMMASALTNAMTARAGKTFFVEIDRLGRFVKSEGMEKLAGGRSGGMGMFGVGAPTTRSLEATIKDMFAGLDAEPVAVGKTWDRVVPISAMGISVPSKGLRTFEKATEEVYQVSYTGKIGEITEADLGAMEGGDRIKRLLESMTIDVGTLAAQSRFARADGLLLGTDSTSKVSITMASPTGEGEISIDITNKQTVTRIEAPKVPVAEASADSRPSTAPSKQ